MEGEKVVATNRKARHEYHIGERFEAGIALQGTEVKSIRDSKINLQDAYCTIENGEVTLINCHISPYSYGTDTNHEPMRPRRLLLHRREIAKLKKAVDQKGFTLVPLSVYFKRGLAKVEIGVARGKKQYDKRADISARDSKRRLDRVLKDARNR
ncbi:MAG TPA: SsrA-binding protein SmpB [Rhodothermia bacterium]|nr:SsrA-binding protein SmpB [Rhodothermia bacterium]